MTTIGLIARTEVADAVSLSRDVVAWAEKQNLTVLLEEETGKALGIKEGLVPSKELAKQADPVVTLGGDGTLIGVARYVSGGVPTMLGVNFGTLGFLTEIAPEDLFPVLEDVLKGKAPIGERSMLYAEVFRDGKSVFSSQAVNEALVQKGSRDKLLDLDLSVDDKPVMRLRADGMIVATPTGSTAYSLAAGGSIAHPLLNVVLVTPICAHSLTARPLILPLDLALTISVPEYTGDVFLSIDGQEAFTLQTGDSVKVTRAENTVHFVRSSKHTYFEILRAKLNWGLANQGG